MLPRTGRTLRRRAEFLIFLSAVLGTPGTAIGASFSYSPGLSVYNSGTGPFSWGFTSSNQQPTNTAMSAMS
jgi:hypothetical protein